MNAFESYGAKYGERVRPPRVKKALEKKEEEQATLQRMWSKWRNERLQAICEGPHGVEALALVSFLDTMTFDDGDELLRRARAWKNVANQDTRFQVLSLIDGAIGQMREKAGLPFADDAIPFTDEPLNMFLVIREMLR